MSTQQVQEVVIGPNPGQQSAAFASLADITVYGGAAGGGKTWLALLRLGVHADQLPGYNAIIFRREMPRITAAGGVWEESMGLFPIFGAKPNSGQFFWRFKERSLIQFRSIQHLSDVVSYRSAQLAEFVFEEGTEFEEAMFWGIFSRLRTTLQRTHGFKARCMITCNPDPDSWVRRLIDWWIGEDGLPIQERINKKRYFVRDGDAMIWGDTPGDVRAAAPHIEFDEHNQPKSIRFIPAKLADNPKGDPTYASRLNALPLVERSQLLGGNWNVRAVAGSYFRRSYFEVIDRMPPGVKKRVRGWDLAATEPNEQNKDPDWTVGVKEAELEDGTTVIEHVEYFRCTPGTRDKRLQAIASQDGLGTVQAFWQDPGQAGKSQRDYLAALLRGNRVRFKVASKDKETYAGPASSDAEHGRIKVLRGAWNDWFFGQLEAFPSKNVHDDAVDALSRSHLEITKPEQDIRPLHIKGL